MLLQPQATLTTEFSAGPALLQQVRRARRRMLFSSFFLPVCSLTAQRRRAMWSLYLFCRLVDDMTDGDLDIAEKHRQLDWWEGEVRRYYRHPDDTPSPIKGLQDAIARYDLQQEHLLAIVEGMRMDASGQMSQPDMKELLHYCYCVAEAVGLLSLRIFGCTRPESIAFAHALGRAMQLTNILRDIRVDAAMGRVYLPREWMQEAGLEGVQAAEIMQHISSLKPVLKQMAAMAQQDYAEAEKLLHPDDRRAMRPALLMRDIYYRLFLSMQRDGWTYRTPYRSNMWDVGCVMVKALGR